MLTTLDDLKTALGITDDTHDDQLNMLINQASAFLERLTGRKFELADYTELHDGPLTQDLVLNQWPIVQVYSILDTFKGVEITNFDISVKGYIGVVFKDDGWIRRGYPYGLAYDHRFPSRYLKVSYQAGYETIPYDIQGLIWQMVGQQYAIINSGALGLKAFRISDVSWDFDKDFSPAQQATLNMYRRM